MWQSVKTVKCVWTSIAIAAIVISSVVSSRRVSAQDPDRPAAPREAGQRPPNPPQPPGPGGPPNFGRGPDVQIFTPLDMLRRPEIQKELELVDEQLDKLRELDERMRDRIRELSTRGRDRPPQGDRPPGGDQDRPPADRDRPPGRDRDRPQPGDRETRRDQGPPPPRNDFRGVSEQINNEVRDELSQILLPEQMKRLGQLQFQMRLRGGGLAIFNGDVARELGITDEQREQLRDKAEGIDRELQKKMAEIRRKAQEEIVSLLDADQQMKFKELLGEPFNFDTPPQPPNRPQPKPQP